jgi:hypothetical protein
MRAAVTVDSAGRIGAASQHALSVNALHVSGLLGSMAGVTHGLCEQGIVWNGLDARVTVRAVQHAMYRPLKDRVANIDAD